MKYTVNVYRVVHFRVVDIEADSQESACKVADKTLTPYLPGLLNREVHHKYGNGPAQVESMVDSEEGGGYLVDERGDEDYERSTHYSEDDIYG